MKPTPRIPSKRVFLTCAALSVMAMNSALSAIVYNADNWYGNYSRIASISNPTTTPPTVNYNTSGNQMGLLWSYFDSPITLEDGMTLTLTTSVTVAYRAGSTPTAVDFRFGLFDSGSLPPATPRINVDSSYVNSWSGFWTSSSTNLLYRRVENSTVNFASTSNTTSVPLADDFSGLSLFPANTAMALTLSLNRSGDDLNFSGTFGGDAFSGTYTNAFANEYSAVFDAVGFTTGSSINGAAGGIQSVTFANTIVILVPEPSSFALLLGTGTLLLAIRKRKGAAK